MTLEEIRERLDYIKDESADDESAHSDEDALRRDFIKYVAESNTHLAPLAALVLESEDYDFARWCA